MPFFCVSQAFHCSFFTVTAMDGFLPSQCQGGGKLRDGVGPLARILVGFSEKISINLAMVMTQQRCRSARRLQRHEHSSWLTALLLTPPTAAQACQDEEQVETSG
ncbi:unnamed protein product [Nippostrongylus brasiliensis]|uniref:Secreted protein n=1 Tax=Nippostrongylus brasiliensis TaxID=27835 RepID=A0A0N4YVL7_NIPBR|nr:unnamed protein product [Nippostrongylus brasiliensis]